MIYEERDIYNQYDISIIRCPKCHGRVKIPVTELGRPIYDDQLSPIPTTCNICEGSGLVQIGLIPYQPNIP
jgi:hypothetical protein